VALAEHFEHPRGGRMIDVKTAVREAIDYLHEFDKYISAHDIRLEETELLDDGHWLITLSFTDDILSKQRIYKAFRISAETGNVMSMKTPALSF
jgi:hypothetical protein